MKAVIIDGELYLKFDTEKEFRTVAWMTSAYLGTLLNNGGPSGVKEDYANAAYAMHDMGMERVLDQIPDGGPYYLTIDADGIDPTIMPAVMAQTPGGLNWLQIRSLIHGLVSKGRVLGMDLVEIAPMHDVGHTTLIHAERLICNFIGATVRAGYYE